MTNRKFFAECERVSRALRLAGTATEVLRIMRSECKMKRRDIADMLDITKGGVAEWERGKCAIMPATQYDTLMELRDVAVILLRTLSPKGVGQWLHARNRLLKARPLAALRERRFKDVREAAESYVEGSYI